MCIKSFDLYVEEAKRKKKNERVKIGFAIGYITGAILSYFVLPFLIGLGFFAAWRCIF